MLLFLKIIEKFLLYFEIFIVLNWIPVSIYYIVTIVICAILYYYLHEEEAESSMLRHRTQAANDLVS